MHAKLLSGTWEFRLEQETEWRPIPVPGCWENEGLPKNFCGPVVYRTRFTVPSEFAGQRIWVRFGGVSYHCTVTVNGQAVGSHTGMWDPFALEITGAVIPGAEAEMLVQVEKAASLELGPGSPALPGNFPLKETLSGFLPYVWGHIFGGIWQDVTLEATGRTVFGDVHVQGLPDGAVNVEAEISGPGEVLAEIIDPAGNVVARGTRSGEGRLVFGLKVAAPRPWSVGAPVLYTARLTLTDGDSRVVTFGLRSVRTDGTTILLNDTPVYPRMALSWGWYWESLHSNPGPDVVREEFRKLKSLGYNGVKLCLWFPPSYYFDLADEEGMLLWVELPMWLPSPSEFFRRQTPAEYDRLVRLARNHPSVIIYSLGCELNRDAGADLLGPLYAMVKSLTGGALIRDNSGSGEAYGGLLNEFADYYDYHFYSDLPLFRNLVDYFAPRWRPVQPWVFGEFCDMDTFRDLRKAYAANGGKAPWWSVLDETLNPQGARWQFEIVEQEERLKKIGFWDRSGELEQISWKQATLHRKFTLEMVRLYQEISGYVITSEVDTPIATSGMWNELGELKFDPAEFSSFNQDLVVLAGWDKRRTWVAGGDRAGYWDHQSYWAGATVRPHIVASHYGKSAGQARVTWSVAFEGEAELPFISGEFTTSMMVKPGTLRELGVVEFAAPAVTQPRQARLRIAVQIGDETATNSWPLWFFPAKPWETVEGVALVDPAGRLYDFPRTAAPLPGLDAASVVIATAWTPEVERFVREGGSAVLLQAGRGPAGPIPTEEMPFWREAVKVIEPHAAWGDFPHEGWADMQFYGVSTDFALDTAKYAGPVEPILRRVDARTFVAHDYAVKAQIGKGSVIVTTLRFEGGLGDTPAGISRNVAASYLLRSFVRHLGR
jgi:hypothetical protein